YLLTRDQGIYINELHCGLININAIAIKARNGSAKFIFSHEISPYYYLHWGGSINFLLSA
ncbi:MAG: hypothetical protein WCF28_02330, partial [Methanobacterium sp.]|uniref:hypothetical protein n=1 Tax=Methanobacterium sp. TaxID=2164 RepID=UPI003C73FB5D